MDWPKELLELFDDPILAGVRSKATRLTPDDRRIRALLEINEWYKANGNKLPEAGIGCSFKEKQLAHKLNALRKEPSDMLYAYDEFNLLKGE